MTAIPTVVYGFAAVFLLTPLVREAAGGSGLCWLSAACVLALLISPTMVLVMDVACANRCAACSCPPFPWAWAGIPSLPALPCPPSAAGC